MQRTRRVCNIWSSRAEAAAALQEVSSWFTEKLTLVIVVNSADLLQNIILTPFSLCSMYLHYVAINTYVGCAHLAIS